MTIRLSDEDGLALAVETAKLSQHRYNVGAVLVDNKGRLLSLGINSSRTSYLQRHYAKKVGRGHLQHEHAEIACLRQIPPGSRPGKIYIGRVGKKGTSLPIHPCPICRAALSEYGVEYVSR